MTADLTPVAQAARVEEVERVARAMWDAEHEPQHGTRRRWEDARDEEPDRYRGLAVAAIDVMRDAADDGALRARVQQLADEFERLPGDMSVFASDVARWLRDALDPR